MAKTSAKSKGYRKQTAKKPYLSKRDIAVLCALLAAVAIGAFLLFNYDDGALKVKDGAIANAGDNWLIVNGSNTQGGVRYYKLGEMGELDGYSREQGTGLTDANIPQYIFTAEDEALPKITVTTTHSGAEAMAKYASTLMAGLEGNEVGEVQSVEAGEHTLHYFTVTSEETEEKEADAEEAAEETVEEAAGEADSAAQPFGRSLSGYIDASHDSSIVIHVESRADSAETLPADDALIAAAQQAVAAVTLEAGK